MDILPFMDFPKETEDTLDESIIYYPDYDHLRGDKKVVINDFKTLISTIKDCYELMTVLSYIQNKVYYPNSREDTDDKIVMFPNDIIKQKVANCFDISIFIEEFCKEKDIACSIAIYVFGQKASGIPVAHAIPIYNDISRNGWYIWNYNNDVKSINGPYKSLSAAVEEYASYINFENNDIRFYPISKKLFYDYLKEEDLEIINRMVLLNKPIKQWELQNEIPTIYKIYNKTLKYAKISKSDIDIMYNGIKKPKTLLSWFKFPKNIAIDIAKKFNKENKTILNIK